MILVTVHVQLFLATRVSTMTEKVPPAMSPLSRNNNAMSNEEAGALEYQPVVDAQKVYVVGFQCAPFYFHPRTRTANTSLAVIPF